jgi:hypothetical protein
MLVGSGSIVSFLEGGRLLAVTVAMPHTTTMSASGEKVLKQRKKG